ncbi:MAG: endonuclease/exonuclease/phosphatase family protein [Actinomycetota bacterium]|nr:endonuclease/exonuclease/phosphatase family protein [Actinomycetota bacterium]
MPSIRIATFNVENLFARWKFDRNVDPSEANKRGWTVDETLFDELSVDDRALTGMAIREVDADVLALQEVENVDTLKHFRAGALGGRRGYPYVAGIDGNDPRLIDVAVLSRLPIMHVRSYQHLLDPVTKTATLFSRDCLEADIDAGDGKTVTLFVNHLKSMMGGRDTTRGKRERQAAAVKEIITKRLGGSPGDEAFVVLGDLNDYLETDEQGSTGIAELVEWDQLENTVMRLPEDQRWTHFWPKGKAYKQLDYLLPSRRLVDTNDRPPEIMRKGTPLRAERYTGERFVGVGKTTRRRPTTARWSWNLRSDTWGGRFRAPEAGCRRQRQRIPRRRHLRGPELPRRARLAQAEPTRAPTWRAHREHSPSLGALRGQARRSTLPRR